VSGVEDLGDLELVLDLLHRTMMDDRSLLVLEPLRWALSLQPEFLAWEQVPTVLPIWEACAKVLAAAGYSVDTGILSAEQYGVPQTRRRAILVASREGRARLPVPTHSRYHNISPDRLDDGLMPWVSMGEALHRDPGSLVLRSNYSSGGSTPGRTAAERGRTMRHGGQPSVTITGKFPQWSRENGNFRITIAEASVLQSFPADYPWRGSLVEQGQQVGDAMPPLLARAIVQELLFPELG
jgi:DNA (cytosine-5)-methyltransferase 1